MPRKGSYKDITNKKFNMLTAIELVRIEKRIGAIWKFRCDCGNEVEYPASRVTSKNSITKSCGCINKNKPPKLDLSGMRFGRLVVTDIYERRRGKSGVKFFWLCKCDCGNEKYVSASLLRNGTILSCGCLHRENITKSVSTHGISKTRIYKILRGMIQRCENPNNSAWEHYGGRGIKICEEWRNAENGALNFYNWSMSNGYKDGLTIERINVEKDYSPDNCKWETWENQHRNTRKTHMIEYKGKKIPLVTACEIEGIKYYTAIHRLKQGATPEQILSKERLHIGTMSNKIMEEGYKNPHCKKVRCHELNKEWDSIVKAEKETGINCGTISKICKGKLNGIRGYHFSYVEDDN